MTTQRREVPGTVLFESVEDVRASIASLRIADAADVLAEVSAASSGTGGHHGVDVDVDADLPLPVECLAQWRSAHILSDRMRAIDMMHHARLGLSRVLRDESSARRLAVVLLRGSAHEDEDDAAQSTGREENVFGEREPDAVPPMEQLETLLPAPDHLSVNVTLKTRLGAARRETGRALAAFLGTARILQCAVDGEIRFNKVERLLNRVISARLTVRQMNGVDEFASHLAPTLSLDQFDKRTRAFIQTYIEDPAPTPESIAALRGVEFQKYPDGWGELRAFGPAVDLEALFQRTRATSRAIARSEFEALTVIAAKAQAKADEEAGGKAASGDQADEDAKSAGTLGGGGLLAVDDRRIGQLMFDSLVGAVPQTEVRVVRRDGDAALGVTASSSSEASHAGESSECADRARGAGATGTPDASEASEASDASGASGDTFLVSVACPTSGTWLRRQAAVTVTMSLATLMGVNDDPGTLGLSTSLPGDQARHVAAQATVWRRLLHDPATGTITDEASRTYSPTAAMRRAVEHKWRTCMAPGCTRNVERCELDHCDPFHHKDPEKGGKTHPDNLIPLCVLHHQLKTEGAIRLRRAGPNEVEWVLPLGVVTRTRAPSSVTDGRQISLLEELLGIDVRSPDFEGSIVQEAIFGREEGERVDVFAGVMCETGKRVLTCDLSPQDVWSGDDSTAETTEPADEPAADEEAADEAAADEEMSLELPAPDASGLPDRPSTAPSDATSTADEKRRAAEDARDRLFKRFAPRADNVSRPPRTAAEDDPPPF